MSRLRRRLVPRSQMADAAGERDPLGRRRLMAIQGAPSVPE